jgi:hypothetical protein
MARRAGRPIVPRCRPRRRSCISLPPRADGSPRPNTTPTQRYAVPRAEHQRRIKTRHRFREARGIGSAGLKGYQSGGRIPTYGGSKQIAWVPHPLPLLQRVGFHTVRRTSSNSASVAITHPSQKQVSGHGFSRAVKAQKEILPHAVARAQRSGARTAYLQVMLGFFTPA